MRGLYLLSALVLVFLSACSGVQYSDVGGVAKVRSVNGSIVMHPRGAEDEELDLNTVNGKIDVGRGYELGNVGTVNGRIQLGPETSAKLVKTVNGSIRIEKNCVAENLRTVNGSIRVEASQVAGDVRTVNGNVQINDGSQIGGGVYTINGRINLDQVSVNKDISIRSGKIQLEDSVIGGDVVINKKRAWWFFDFPWRDPKVVIGPNAIVKGQIIALRDIKLYVHESAQIGGVEGALPEYYSGDRP